MENKQDLLARKAVGAQLSPYWANRQPEIKWVQTNSMHSAQYTSTPAYLQDPPSDFSKGLVLSLTQKLDSGQAREEDKVFNAYLHSSH